MCAFHIKHSNFGLLRKLLNILFTIYYALMHYFLVFIAEYNIIIFFCVGLGRRNHSC